MNPFNILETELALLVGDQGELDQARQARYRREPDAYARERLGVTLLPHQLCLVYAIAGLWERITPAMAELAHLTNPGKRRIAVSSGQKTGKTKALIVVAFWHFECFPASRTMLTAAIETQIRAVLWKELKDTRRLAPHTPPGVPSEDPRRGLLSPDESREIRGFTGRTIEAMAGISGNLLYLIDEGSFLEGRKFEAIRGNTAGGGDLGGPIVMTSQPTRGDGPFFEAFHTKSDQWTTMVFDSEEISTWCASKGVRVPGIATPERMKEWRDEEGEDSPFFQVRVKGRFLRNETGRVISIHLIEAARHRWRDAPDDEGELAIGFDPAGPGDAGDEHGFAVVRGAKCLDLYTRRGLSEDAALAELYHLLERHRGPAGTPRIMLDAEGNIGAAFYGRLRAEAEIRRVRSPSTAFHVYGVRTSSRHVRAPDKFGRIRDEVWWNLAAWMRDGAIPTDHKLDQELHAPTWSSLPDGRIRATSKVDLRDMLGRSTDRADALALAVDPPRVWRSEVEDSPPAPPPQAGDANAWAYGDAAPAGTDAGDPNAWTYER